MKIIKSHQCLYSVNKLRMVRSLVKEGKTKENSFSATPKECVLAKAQLLDGDC